MEANKRNRAAMDGSSESVVVNTLPSLYIALCPAYTDSTFVCMCSLVQANNVGDCDERHTYFEVANAEASIHSLGCARDVCGHHAHRD